MIRPPPYTPNRRALDPRKGNISCELAERGLSVGLIDADPQRSAGQWASPDQLPFKVYAMPLSAIW